MRVQCAWCGKQLPQKGERTGKVTHGICLPCIDNVLREAGSEAEHQLWLRAFQQERTTRLLTKK